MADWEYKEDTWRVGVKPNLSQVRVLDENKTGYDDGIWYAVRGPGLGYSLDENGYPQQVGFEFENGKEVFIKGDTKETVLPQKEAFIEQDNWIEKANWDFPTWLGHHSREGWEIFKISRDFRAGSEAAGVKATWCIFRRTVN